MNRITLLRQLKSGIITQDRYDRILDIIEHDEQPQTNIQYIDNLIHNGLIENRKQSAKF
jgi:hypothetical protein